MPHGPEQSGRRGRAERVNSATQQQLPWLPGRYHKILKAVPTSAQNNGRVLARAFEGQVIGRFRRTGTYEKALLRLRPLPPQNPWLRTPCAHCLRKGDGERHQCRCSPPHVPAAPASGAMSQFLTTHSQVEGNSATSQAREDPHESVCLHRVLRQSAIASSIKAYWSHCTL